MVPRKRCRIFVQTHAAPSIQSRALCTGGPLIPVGGECGEVGQVDSLAVVEVCACAPVRGGAGVEPEVGDDPEIGGVDSAVAVEVVGTEGGAEDRAGTSLCGAARGRDDDIPKCGRSVGEVGAAGDGVCAGDADVGGADDAGIVAKDDQLGVCVDEARRLAGGVCGLEEFDFGGAIALEVVQDEIVTAGGREIDGHHGCCGRSGCGVLADGLAGIGPVAVIVEVDGEAEAVVAVDAEVAQAGRGDDKPAGEADGEVLDAGVVGCGEGIVGYEYAGGACAVEIDGGVDGADGVAEACIGIVEEG